VRDDRQARLTKEALHDVLVHADRRPEDAGPHERHLGQAQEALQRTVFSERAVEHGEDDVDGFAPAFDQELSAVLSRRRQGALGAGSRRQMHLGRRRSVQLH
jgi:hypothetical protein